MGWMRMRSRGGNFVAVVWDFTMYCVRGWALGVLDGYSGLRSTE